MSLEDAFRPAEEHYRAEVVEDTWGHFAPKRNKKYSGRIVYAVGCYGNDHLNPTVLSCELRDLDDSPWFYDCLDEFLHAQEISVGFVYEFVGYFKNYEFIGKIRAIFNANGINAED